MQGTFGGLPLLDPIQERRNWQQAEQKWPLPAEFAYANALVVPLGEAYGRGWLLMPRAALNQLGAAGLNVVQSLSLTDDYGTTKTFYGLVYVTARNVSPGADLDPRATYLVEVADSRWLAYNPIYAIPINRQYNVRAPAFGGQYYDDTVVSTTTLTGTLTNGNPVVTGLGSTATLLAGNPVIGVGIPANTQILSVDSGTQVTLTKNATTGSSQTLKFQQPWTWALMVADVWAVCAVLGAAPGLPATANVDGVPEGWIFNGISAYKALNQILDRLSCGIAADLSQPVGSQFTIVNVGAADAVALALINTAQPRKIHDEDFQEAIAGRVPYGVTVLFHRQQLDYGSERTTPQTTGANGQFTTNAVYSIQVPGPAAIQPFAQAGIYHPIWDDMPALYDAGGSLLNGAALTTRSLSRQADFYNSLLSTGGERLRKVFSGLLNFVPSSTIRGVAWRQWHDGGLVTEIVRHPFRMLKANDQAQWEESDTGSTALQPRDLRPTFPVYPHLMQELRVANGTADGSGRFDAYVQATDPNALTVSDQERVWAVEATGATTVATGDVIGRLLGYNNGRPVYVFQRGGSSGGGSLTTVEYDDSSLQISSVTDFQVSKLDFILSSPGAGKSLLKTRGLTGTVQNECDWTCVGGLVTVKYRTLTFQDGLCTNFGTCG
jgi:hypothetical protein